MPIVAHPFDPEDVLKSSVRAVCDYVQQHSPVFASDYPLVPLRNKPVYEVIQETIDQRLQKVPLERTVIVFEIDDVNPMAIGFGQNRVKETTEVVPATLPATGTKTVITNYEAVCFEINFDVGVWAFDQTGGTTSRMDANSLLMSFLHGASARQLFNVETDGVQIRSWSGGRDVQDKINDIPVYRTVGAELVVRVFGRVPAVIVDTDTAVEEFVIIPDLELAGTDTPIE